jgi:hypothetical protein
MMSDALDESRVASDPTAEAATLRKRLRLLAAGFTVVIAAAVAAMVVLGDTARTDDLRRLAALAVLAGLAGGATVSLLTLTSLGDGIELSDGTSLLRGRAAASYARELRAWEQHRSDAEARGYAPLPRPEPSGGFSVSEIPEVLVSPLLGAVLGFVAFAGIVGGFLVASTSPGTTYSPAAVTFISFLSGMFAQKFLRRLSGAADALFGTLPERRGPDRHAQNEPPHGRNDAP